MRSSGALFSRRLPRQPAPLGCLATSLRARPVSVFLTPCLIPSPLRRTHPPARSYPEALHSFRDAAAAHPADPLARFRAANAHFALHQYNDASRAYFDCLQRCPEGANDPLRAKAHVNLGIALESEGRAGAAAREYAKAAALDPAHPRAHKLLGSARCAAGDFHGAVEALTAALEVNPGFADAWGDLGCAYAALGDVGNAERCLGQAVTHDPGHLEARYNMGNLRRQGHDFEGAVACYDAVLAADPSHWRSLLNKAVVQTCSGRGAAAAGNLKAALHLSGAGGVLAAEVDRLQALLRADAGWEEVDQVLAQIDGTAGKVAAGVLTGGDGRALAAAVARGRGEASPGRGPPSVASAARSAKSAKSARSVRSSLSYSPTKNLSPVKSLSPTKSPQRIATWVRPAGCAVGGRTRAGARGCAVAAANVGRAALRLPSPRAPSAHPPPII
jgi:tetratricopeptide (TPR) repeat protein